MNTTTATHKLPDPAIEPGGLTFSNLRQSVSHALARGEIGTVLSC